jgi:hypothetical protein
LPCPAQRGAVLWFGLTPLHAIILQMILGGSGVGIVLSVLGIAATALLGHLLAPSPSMHPCGIDQAEVPEAQDHELNGESGEQHTSHPGDDLQSRRSNRLDYAIG